MSMKPLCLCLSVLLATATSSQAGEQRPQPAMPTDEMLRWHLPDAEQAQVEVRLDVDFTGDGLRDSAFVLRGNETRILKVMVGYATDVDIDYVPAGEMAMDPSPLGSASLSAKKGVLIVEDLAGGTTAIQSLYRFRFDPKARRMRLIGDDVTLYSRTSQHDSTAISTNRLTGAQVVTRSVVGEDGYTDQPQQKKTVPTRPIYMEDAPSPAETLGWGD